MNRVTIYIAIALLLSGLPMQAEPDTMRRYDIIRNYAKAQKYLRTGDAEQRIYAAEYLGVKKNRRYLRDLGDELNSDLDPDSPYFTMHRNDPYVKSKIAWALGNIGHQGAMPYLLEGLERTYKIIALQHKEVMAKRDAESKRYESEKSALGGSGVGRVSTNREPFHSVIVPNDRPGPFLYSQTHAFQYSPDIYWSISDEFKTLISTDQGNLGNRMRMRGFNYINLYFHLIDAIGEIYKLEIHKENVRDEHLAALGKFLTQDKYAFIRSAAVIALGKIGSPGALTMLQNHYKTEKDEEVKARVCHSILLIEPANIDYYNDLLGYLKSNKHNVRYVSAIALRELNTGESLPYLKEAHLIEGQSIIRDVLEEAIKRVHNSYFQTPIPD